MGIGEGSLQTNANMTLPAIVPVQYGEAVLFTCPSPDKPINEDSGAVFDVSANACVLAVADGVGGGPRGQDASRLAVQALATHLAQANDDTALRPVILDAFETAQADILELGNGAATTLVVAELSYGSLRTYHTGDSGAFLTGRGGKLKHKTVFHSPSGYAEESGLLLEADAMLHEERHYVSNLLGDSQMSVELSAPVPLARFDTLVVGSDGLFDNLSIEEISHPVRTGPLLAASESLLAQVQQRMQASDSQAPSKPDDLAFILFRSRSA